MIESMRYAATLAMREAGEDKAREKQSKSGTGGRVMTNQEAIKWLREAEILDLTCGNTKDREAVNMAIKALEAQAHIVNCPDCKYAMRNQGELWICGHPNNNAWRITDDFYCGRGMT
jgi:hypothetical protein